MKRLPIVISTTIAALAAIAGTVWQQSLPETPPPRGSLAFFKERAARFLALPPAERPALCFAPGTPPEIALLFQSEDDPPLQFQADDRWTQTATDGFASGQGTPITLTWSIVPNGATVPGGVGEPTSGSNLRSWLDNQYGSINVWLPLFEQSFDRWGELTGVTYVYEPSDDGAQLGSAPGVLGVRGDVRIAGHPIDGFANTLAYNSFPNNGDMVIDTSDGFYNVKTNNSRRLRNVIMHEHGHGLGLSHVCPINRTKLMEPFITETFDGPQLDDILGGQRNYGDPDENNNSNGGATSLGLIVDATVVRNNLSIDDNSDADFYSFSVPAGNAVTATITVTPTGQTYVEGPQVDSACSASTSFDSLRVHNLGVELRTASTVLASSNAGAEGVAESISGFALPGTGPYYVRVFGDNSNDIQGYRLSVAVEAPASGIFALSSPAYSVDEDGGSVAVTITRTGDTGEQESVSWSTADGSATAGTDYTDVSGIATFDPGEATKDFSVPIIDNDSFIGPRTFSISLGNPTGNAVVGSPASASITINEDDSPGLYPFIDDTDTNVGTIPGAPDGEPLPSSVYPLTIEVAGVIGDVLVVKVELEDLTHEFPRDLDILLVGPLGQSAMLLSDAGGDENDALAAAEIGFNDGGIVLPDRDTGLIPGQIYSPVNLTSLSNTEMVAPAPTGPYGTSLSVFNGVPPNGTWSLYFLDDWASADGGSLGGWSLLFTTTQAAPAPVLLEIASLGFDGTTVTIEVESQGGSTFALQRSSSLGGWQTIQTGLVPGPNPWTVMDTPPATSDRWYYRILTE